MAFWAIAGMTFRSLREDHGQAKGKFKQFADNWRKKALICDIHMPEFACLDRTFSLTQVELDRAPDCVLAQAWGASSNRAPVKLTFWQEPDLLAFEVQSRSPADGRQVECNHCMITVGCRWQLETATLRSRPKFSVCQGSEGS